MHKSFFVTPGQVGVREEEGVLLFVGILFARFVTRVNSGARLVLITVASEFGLGSVLLKANITILILGKLTILTKNVVDAIIPA